MLSQTMTPRKISSAPNKIKQKYGGYHFAEDAEEVFNPFSLLNALGDRQLSNYWSTYSTPPFLINQMQHFNTIR